MPLSGRPGLSLSGIEYLTGCPSYYTSQPPPSFLGNSSCDPKSQVLHAGLMGHYERLIPGEPACVKYPSSRRCEWSLVTDDQMTENPLEGSPFWLENAALV